MLKGSRLGPDNAKKASRFTSKSLKYFEFNGIAYEPGVECLLIYIAMEGMFRMLK